MGGNSDKTTHASVSPLIMLYRSTPEIWTKPNLNSEHASRQTRGSLNIRQSSIEALRTQPTPASVQHRSTENSTYTCISPAQKHWELNLHLHQSSTEALRTQPTSASVQHRSTENSTYICISPAQKHRELTLTSDQRQAHPRQRWQRQGHTNVLWNSIHI